MSYLAGSIRQYKEAIERYYGIDIKDIPERTVLVNRRNKDLMRLYAYADEWSYGAYLDMLHGLLQKPLREQKVPKELPKAIHPEGKKVFVIGSTQTGSKIIRLIEEAGFHIVGDRLPESHRQFSLPKVSLEGDIFENIAASMISAMPSPTQNDFSRILHEDRIELQRKEVWGVIFITQKYCEPYDYIFPVYQKMLNDMDIKHLHVTITGQQNKEAAALAIETFANMM